MLQVVLPGGAANRAGQYGHSAVLYKCKGKIKTRSSTTTFVEMVVIILRPDSWADLSLERV